MGSLDDYISQATDLLNKHDIEGAIQLYQEALKLDPDDHRFDRARGRVR